MTDPTKNLSTEQRLLLAFVLMGGVIFLSQYLLPKPPQPVAQQQKKAAEPAKQQEAPAATPTATPPASPAAPAVQEGGQAEFPVFENDLYKVKFSNKGVSVGPGQSAFSVTPLRANSRARVLVKAIIPPLHAA